MTEKMFRLIMVPVKVLSFKACLLWLTGGWVLYYVSTAIWMDEAFAFFVHGVKSNILIQIPFLLFLASGYLNILRAFRDKMRQDRAGFIVWLMIATGTMLYFTGLFLSINVRQYDNRLVGEGHSLKLPWDEETYYFSVVDPGLKESFKKSDPGGILAYEPKITMTDSSANSYTIGAYPPTRIDGTYMHILNYGLAPGIRFYDKETLVEEGYMVLRILPPGRSDFFEIKPYSFRFLVFLAPEYTENGGHHPEPIFNFKNPMVTTRVFSGERMIAEGDSREGLRFKGYHLSFFEPAYWIQLESARDPGMPVMRFGLLILILGVPLYILRLILSLFMAVR
jgi:hypothetical protein